MIWNTIPSAPGYEASNTGLIRNKIRPSAYLKPWTNPDKHLYINVGAKKGKLHHFIMEAFGKNRPDVLECRHLDGNPRNNHIDNLEWGTRAQNIRDYINHNGKHMRPNSTPVDIAQKIKKEHDGKRGTGKRLADKYGVSVFTVSEIKTGKTFKYL